jgi:ketosteroid isomerase-like protein
VIDGAVIQAATQQALKNGFRLRHAFEAVRAVRERWESDWDDLETVGEEYLDAGEDKVMATIRYTGRGRGSGIELQGHGALIVRCRGGKLVAVTLFQGPEEALAAAGAAAAGRSAAGWRWARASAAEAP